MAADSIAPRNKITDARKKTKNKTKQKNNNGCLFHQTLLANIQTQEILSPLFVAEKNVNLAAAS